MRVLFVSYYSFCQSESGGVQVRMRSLANSLRSKGVEVDFYNPNTTIIRNYDILHVFSLSIDTWGVVRFAKSVGIKIVISTIVPLVGKGKLLIYKLLSNIPIVTTFTILKNQLKIADAIITESNQEALFLRRYYNTSYDKVSVIPNGVNANNYKGKDVYDIIGKECSYVLQVGRFDQNKNQLSLIKALKDTDIDVVFIGGEVKPKDSYYLQCQNEAQGYNNFHFLGWVPNNSDLLRSAYSYAKCLVLPSFFETFGMVAIEAGAAGSDIVLSNTLPIKEYTSFRDCLVFNPQNIQDIKEKVMMSFQRLSDRNEIQLTFLSEFNWDNVAIRHIKVYENIL